MKYSNRARLFGALALSLALTLAGCGEKNPAGDVTPTPEPTSTPAQATPTPTPVPTGPAYVAPEWSSQEFARTFTAGDGTEVLKVSYTLPLVQNTDLCPAAERINQWYKDEGSSRLADAEENYEAAVSDYAVSSAAGYEFKPTTEEMSYEITRSDEQMISVRRDWYVGGGAPYPSQFCLSEQFDPLTGEKLSFADIFTDADTVQQRVVDAMLQTQPIQDGGFTREEIEVAIQLESFYCTEEGYVFWLQGNTLPALHSPVEATLSYAALKDVSLYGA